MSYIGQSPTNIAFVTDTFSGTGTTTAFTMSVAPASTTSVLVAITGVLQDPSTYSVSGTTLTFSAAPPSGTNNISVRYLGIPASGVTTTAYRTVTNFTATAGQTTFTPPSYTAGYLDVYRNGSKLALADFTATNGTTVVLNNACNAGDVVETDSFYVSSVLNAIPATAGAVNSTYLASGVAVANIGSRALLQSQMPAGTILQVVNASYSTDVTVSSTTFVDTGLTASITPTSATSKILVFAQHNGLAKVNDAYIGLKLLRSGTTIANFGNAIAYTGSATANRVGGAAMSYLDSPATTSTLTYKTQIQSGGNNASVTVQDNSALSTITLMEIAV